jgi:2-hydroxychromene-2-carboxylate isomerase
MRVEALAIDRGVSLVWRPFLLGPLFAGQGWRDSPFNLFPVKGRYMWRDMERICDALDLPLRRPESFPQNSLLAARVALALDDALRPAFSRAVYQAEFGQGRPIDAPATLGALLEEIGVAPDPLLARAVEDSNKAALKAQTARAMALGLPGAPCLTTADGEVFWGNDRLEQGLDWARAHDSLAE